MPAAEQMFDPLASLFDAPPIQRGPALPPVTEEEEREITGSMEPTDPVGRHALHGAPLFDPADAEAPDLPFALRDSAPSVDALDSEDEVPTERQELAEEDDASVEDSAEDAGAAEEEEVVEEAPAEVGPSPEERAALAKRLAAEAIARAQAAKPAAPAGPSPEERAALAKRLAAEAIARAQAAKKPAPAAEPSDDERVALAKRLAAEALARAQAAKKTAAEPKKKKPVSRLDSLASRARRPRSAADALREAAEAERLAREEAAATAAAEAARKAVHALADRVDVLLRRQLPGVDSLEVVNAMLVDDRNLMRALWKAHRARFASEGRVDQVVSTTHVIRALDAVATHQLAAAIVNTAESDYLVFIDLGTQATVAAFPDARAWYAGVRT
ncbi:MAG: hypothetical protein H6740_22340 [Alphaproteobacteria bacterium]|nr:hypothetical protein [Alphaproteobacteria bacterium]